jgi:ABC-type multidrug transport system fused ATPase/permease subunit
MGILFAESVGLFYYIVRDCQNELDATSLGFDTCSDYWNYAADDMQKRSFYIALYFTLVVIDTLLGGMFLYWGFGQASERLSKRVRDSTFVALVRQEIGYFDKHSIGDITSELQNSTARLQAFTGAPVRSFLEASAGLLTGIIIAFVVSFREQNTFFVLYWVPTSRS